MATKIKYKREYNRVKRKEKNDGKQNKDPFALRPMVNQNKRATIAKSVERTRKPFSFIL
jgi:hypothetical protein